jgi:putative DNA primase/helicase
LPGILNWALDGFEQLIARGKFVQPQSASEALREMEDLGSPIAAFVRDRCVLGPHGVTADALFNAWKNWCSDNGRDRPGTKQTFGRDLRAAVPGLRTVRPRDDEDRARQRHYVGIGLKASDDHNG